MTAPRFAAVDDDTADLLTELAEDKPKQQEARPPPSSRTGLHHSWKGNR